MSLQVACGHPPGPTPPADYAPPLRSPWRAALVKRVRIICCLRDGRRGTLQVNYGLMTNDRGCPAAVTVHVAIPAVPLRRGALQAEWPVVHARQYRRSHHPQT